MEHGPSEETYGGVTMVVVIYDKPHEASAASYAARLIDRVMTDTSLR